MRDKTTRAELELEELVGRTVTSVEDAEDYAVLRFDDGSTLYVDSPTLYGTP